jgi:hypothetical protein
MAMYPKLALGASDGPIGGAIIIHQAGHIMSRSVLPTYASLLHTWMASET